METKEKIKYDKLPRHCILHDDTSYYIKGYEDINFKDFDEALKYANLHNITVTQIK